MAESISATALAHSSGYDYLDCDHHAAATHGDVLNEDDVCHNCEALHDVLSCSGPSCAVRLCRTCARQMHLPVSDTSLSCLHCSRPTSVFLNASEASPAHDPYRDGPRPPKRRRLPFTIQVPGQHALLPPFPPEREAAPASEALPPSTCSRCMQQRSALVVCRGGAGSHGRRASPASGASSAAASPVVNRRLRRGGESDGESEAGEAGAGGCGRRYCAECVVEMAPASERDPEAAIARAFVRPAPPPAPTPPSPRRAAPAADLAGLALRGLRRVPRAAAGRPPPLRAQAAGPPAGALAGAGAGQLAGTGGPGGGGAPAVDANGRDFAESEHILDASCSRCRHRKRVIACGQEACSRRICFSCLAKALATGPDGTPRGDRTREWAAQRVEEVIQRPDWACPYCEELQRASEDAAAGAVMEATCHRCHHRRLVYQCSRGPSLPHAGGAECQKRFCERCLTKTYAELAEESGAGEEERAAWVAAQLAAARAGRPARWPCPSCTGHCPCSRCRPAAEGAPAPQPLRGPWCAPSGAAAWGQGRRVPSPAPQLRVACPAAAPSGPRRRRGAPRGGRKRTGRRRGRRGPPPGPRHGPPRRAGGAGSCTLYEASLRLRQLELPIGLFDAAEKAARAHDLTAILLYGPERAAARTNFPLGACARDVAALLRALGAGRPAASPPTPPASPPSSTPSTRTSRPRPRPSPCAPPSLPGPAPPPPAARPAPPPPATPRPSAPLRGAGGGPASPRPPREPLPARAPPLQPTPRPRPGLVVAP
eukprot:tig00000984_g5977.t1